MTNEHGDDEDEDGNDDGDDDDDEGDDEGDDDDDGGGGVDDNDENDVNYNAHAFGFYKMRTCLAYTKSCMHFLFTKSCSHIG